MGRNSRQRLDANSHSECHSNSYSALLSDQLVILLNQRQPRSILINYNPPPPPKKNSLSKQTIIIGEFCKSPSERHMQTWGSFLEGPEKVLHPKRRNKLSNPMVTELFYSERGSLHTRCFRCMHLSGLDTDQPKIALRA